MSYVPYTDHRIPHHSTLLWRLRHGIEGVDVLGRHSLEGCIFAVKSSAIFKTSCVVSIELKALAWAGGLFFNYYYFGMCVLYATDKGIVWQDAWQFVSLLCVVMLLFFDVSFEAYMIGYAIPMIIPVIRDVQAPDQESPSEHCRRR